MRTDLAPLFTPGTLGAIEVPNRIVMAPMTRSRAGADGVPAPMTATYYRQRASAGLIVSEMAQVAADGRSYAGTPGIHDDAQVAGWRRVTDAVHAEGGRIVLQLAFGGRISHSSLIGVRPVAPSAIAPSGTVFTAQGAVPFETPRALEAAELPGIVARFRDAAARARAAGFDGVELHAANGYLLDQFLRSGTNRRTDAYGGLAANRARLLLEVVEAVVGVWGPGRVGVRVSPFSPFNDMGDDDPFVTYPVAARLLDAHPLAYLHVSYTGAAPEQRERMATALRAAFGGAIVANDGYSAETAAAALARGDADAIAFGTPFLANPDLVRRFALDAPLAEPDRATFYGGDERGYTDYPALRPVAA